MATPEAHAMTPEPLAPTTVSDSVLPPVAATTKRRFLGRNAALHSATTGNSPARTETMDIVVAETKRTVRAPVQQV